MKKYRIVIYIYNNGRTEYMPQFKKFFIWRKIGVDGDLLPYTCRTECLERAQNRIDLHYKGNTVLIEKKYEYQYKD